MACLEKSDIDLQVKGNMRLYYQNIPQSRDAQHDLVSDRAYPPEFHATPLQSERDRSVSVAVFFL